MTRGIVISIGAYSVTWSQPFIELGYTTVRVDPMHAPDGRAGFMDDGGFALGVDPHGLVEILSESPHGVRQRLRQDLGLQLGRCRTVGMVMMPPCTDFSNNGARWFAEKDKDGRTEKSIAVVRACLRAKDLAQPDWWALENPVG